MKSSHLPWAKNEQTIKEIDLQEPFNDYWSTKEHKITVLGQSYSPTSPPVSDGEAQRSLT